MAIWIKSVNAGKNLAKNPFWLIIKADAKSNEIMKYLTFYNMSKLMH